MITIELSKPQIALLDATLERLAGDEYVEVRHSEPGAYKTELRDHLQRLVEIRGRLQPSLTLAANEADVLARVVRHELSDLRVEIRHTDTWSYKAGLRTQADELREVLAALEEALVANVA